MSRTVQFAIATGDPALETAVHEALEAAGHRAIRCLSATELLSGLRARSVDAALVGSDLYQLTTERWAALEETGVPLVLRASPADTASYPGAVAQFDPATGAATLVPALLQAALVGPAPRVGAPPVSPQADVSSHAAPSQAGSGGRVLTISGPAGSGRTTVAANLALALGTVAPTAIVDADLHNPALVAALDGDVTRHLAALAQAAPDQPSDWDRLLAREGQPLHAYCQHGVLFGGLPRPEQRGAISRAFGEQLIAALRQRFAYVLLDAGGDVLSPDTGLHRAALLAADELLVVVRADPLGVLAARTLLELWERQLGVTEERLALVVTGHDRRIHPHPATIAMHLRVPVAAVLREDRATLHRAQLERRPALFTSGRFARDLLAFADRVHGGRLRLPETVRPRHRLRWPFSRSRGLSQRGGGSTHGGTAVAAP